MGNHQGKGFHQPRVQRNQSPIGLNEQVGGLAGTDQDNQQLRNLNNSPLPLKQLLEPRNRLNNLLDGRDYIYRSLEEVEAEKQLLRPFDSTIGEDPMPERDIVNTGRQYIFLKKSANKLMHEDKRQNVRYVFIDAAPHAVEHSSPNSSVMVSDDHSPSVQEVGCANNSLLLSVSKQSCNLALKPEEGGALRRISEESKNGADESGDLEEKELKDNLNASMHARRQKSQDNPGRDSPVN